MNGYKQKWALFVLLISVKAIIAGSFSNLDSCANFNIYTLKKLDVTTNTGEKPQSKLWFHDNNWWAVLPNENGTELWQLVDSSWVAVLHLSDSKNIKTDVRKSGDITHILLFNGLKSELVSVEYDAIHKRYQLWSKRTENIKIKLEKFSETATIDIDLSGRMWLASDDQTEIHIRWSDPPYKVWSKPQTIATGIKKDDICAITAFPNGSVSVLWSNQRTKRFGFRIHILNTSPDNWLEDEVPAASSAIPWEDGMADDHLNIAVSSNGTLYAVVKTSYDTPGYPLIAFLVRRPSGKWDKLYYIDDEGSRGIVLLDEEKDCLMVVYTSYRDHQIVCKTSRTETISFGERYILMNSNYKIKSINNVTSTKQNIINEVVIVASEYGIARSVIIKFHK